jgi:hypothetical protein
VSRLMIYVIGEANVNRGSIVAANGENCERYIAFDASKIRSK